MWPSASHRSPADGTPEQVFTETLLSRAYEADISVVQNPRNGRLEISTRENPEAKQKELSLLQKICLRN